MKNFLIKRIESTVHLLSVYADNQEAALIKAENGPLNRVLDKEGVELVRTTSGLTETKVVDLVRFQIQCIAKPENTMFDETSAGFIDDQNRMVDKPFIHECESAAAATLINNVREQWGKDNVRVVEIPFV